MHPDGAVRPSRDPSLVCVSAHRDQSLLWGRGAAEPLARVGVPATQRCSGTLPTSHPRAGSRAVPELCEPGPV